MNDKMFTVYSIKYINTMGIKHVDGCEIYNKEYATRKVSGWDQFFQKIGVDCFLTIEEARKAGILKLEKQVKSLTKKMRVVEEKIADLKSDIIRNELECVPPPTPNPSGGDPLEKGEE